MVEHFNLTNTIDLHKLQAKPFTLNGICHLGIEDEWIPSPTLREFLTVSDTFAADTLVLQTSAIDFAAVRRVLLSPGAELKHITGEIREIKRLAPGIVLKLLLPKCSPVGDDGFFMDYTSPRTAFVYGATYEAALILAADFADAHLSFSLSTVGLTHETPGIISPNFRDAGLGRLIVQSIRDTVSLWQQKK